RDLYQAGQLSPTIPYLEPFFEENYSVEDYLRLDDHILMYAISVWINSEDRYLSTLAKMFLNRQPLKSVEFNQERDTETVEYLRGLVDELFYDRKYFTMTNRSSDISYDYSLKEKAPITLMHENGQMVDLSEVSPIVRILSDNL